MQPNLLHVLFPIVEIIYPFFMKSNYNVTENFFQSHWDIRVLLLCTKYVTEQTIRPELYLSKHANIFCIGGPHTSCVVQRSRQYVRPFFTSYIFDTDYNVGMRTPCCQLWGSILRCAFCLLCPHLLSLGPKLPNA